MKQRCLSSRQVQVGGYRLLSAGAQGDITNEISPNSIPRARSLPPQVHPSLPPNPLLWILGSLSRPTTGPESTLSILYPRHHHYQDSNQSLRARS